MANPSLQIGNDNWAIKEDNLLGYSTAGTRFVPQPITMTRATLGTRVNPSGLVEDVALLGSELVTNGDFASDSDWNKTGTWSIESNYATASGNSTSQYIQQDFTITNGKTYLFTYEIIENTLNGNGSSLSGSGGFVSVSLSSVIGTHQVYITADDSGAAYALKIGVSGTATTGTIKLDNVSVKEATIDNLPRVDYTDGTSSLLVEPQRTNELTQSNQFDTTWIQSGTLTSGQDGVGGSTNAWKFENPNATSSLYQTDTTSGVQTLSAYFKKNSNYGVRFFAFGSVNCWAYFDLNNGTVVLTGNSTAKVESAGADWFRCSMTFDQTTSSCRFYVTNNTSTQVVGNITLQYAQLEQGSYATSYIPTSGSTVTRNQETYTKTGISDKINSEEGVLFAEISRTEDESNYRLLGLDNGTSQNYIKIGFGNNNGNFWIRALVNGVTVINSDNAVSNNANQFYKIAVRYKSGDSVIYIDGVPVLTSSTTFSSGTFTDLDFTHFTGSSHFFGKVKQLQIFKTALSDSELATLTT